MFDEKLSLLNFKNKGINDLKNSILRLVVDSPEISSKDLREQMVNKGFAVQINNFIQSNYPTRLNFDLEHLNEENISKIFKELLSLFNTNMI